VNIQNILSQGIVPNFQSLSDAQLINKLKAFGIQISGMGRSLWNLLARE
jgi:hypothetical protein